MKLQQSTKIAPIVPTASMADIAFLLIIFFMLTTTSAVDKADVQLPESVVRLEVEVDAAVASIDSRGVLRFSNGSEISTEVANDQDFDSRVQEVLRNEPDKQFIIKVDKSIKYLQFNKVYERLRNLQVRRINLLTEQKIVK